MDLLTRLATLLGFTLKDGETPTLEQLTDTLKGVEDLTVVATGINELLAEARGALKVDSSNDELLSAAELVSQTGKAIEVETARRVEVQAKIDGLKDVEVPAAKPVEDTAEDEAKAAEVKDEVKQETETGDEAKADEVKDEKKKLDPPLTNLEPVHIEKAYKIVNDAAIETTVDEAVQAIAAALLVRRDNPNGARNLVASLPIEITQSVDTVMDTAIAAACVGVDAGTCSLPAIDTTIEDCYVVTTPTLAATQPSGIARRPGQTVMYREKNGLPGGPLQVWDAASRDGLYDIDPITGERTLKTGAALEAAMKTCTGYVCKGLKDAVGAKIYRCIECLPNDIDEDALRSEIRGLLAQLTLDAQTVVHDFLFDYIETNTLWVDNGSIGVTTQNAVAHLLAMVSAVVAERNSTTEGAPGVWDMIGPNYLQQILAPENYLRETPLNVSSYSALISGLTELGVRYIGTNTGFSGPIDTAITGAGVDAWHLPASPGGTFVTPGNQTNLPTNLFFILVPRGSVKFDISEFVRFGFDASRQPANIDDARKNCFSLFAEDDYIIFFDHCIDPVGIRLCIEPQGAMYARAALPASVCPAPGNLNRQAQAGNQAEQVKAKAGK